MIGSISHDSVSTANSYQPTFGTQTQTTNSSSPVVSLAAVADSVQLSATAQVSALYQEGMTATEIAASMSLTTAEVNSYLGIATSSSTASSGVAASGGGGGAAQASGGTNTPAPETLKFKTVAAS